MSRINRPNDEGYGCENNMRNKVLNLTQEHPASRFPLEGKVQRLYVE